MPAPPLVVQTTYAELLERCASAAFENAFAENGAFTSKTVRGRRYWYFQTPSGEGRTQKYVGPETPELLEQITHHKEARDDERERRALVSTLVRSFKLPRPIPEIGNVIAALAKAGVFRLRGVLIGTVAYQTYSAMLSVKLPLAILQTGDVDIAQFKNVSAGIGDHTSPVLEVLKEVDTTFRAVPNIHGEGRVTSYRAKGGLRVDFLTPNQGSDADTPQSLPAFQTDAQPIRFLDYLIHEPEAAVVLHNAGAYVFVPAPERYALHKLIVSRRRREGEAKRDKDLMQAEALLDILAWKRSYELKAAWEEALQRGQKWRQLLFEGLSQLKPASRDVFLKVVDGRRSMIPGLDLKFNDRPPRYDSGRGVVTYAGESGSVSVQCAISREALGDHYGDAGNQREWVVKFLENRSAIERMTRVKYLSWPVEEPGAVLITTEDIPKLLKGEKVHLRSLKQSKR